MSDKNGEHVARGWVILFGRCQQSFSSAHIARSKSLKKASRLVIFYFSLVFFENYTNLGESRVVSTRLIDWNNS